MLLLLLSLSLWLLLLLGYYYYHHFIISGYDTWETIIQCICDQRWSWCPKKNVTSWQYFGFKPDVKGESTEYHAGNVQALHDSCTGEGVSNHHLHVHLPVHHPAEASKLARGELWLAKIRDGHLSSELLQKAPSTNGRLEDGPGAQQPSPSILPKRWSDSRPVHFITGKDMNYFCSPTALPETKYFFCLY